MALRLVRLANLAPDQTVRCSLCKEARTTQRIAGSTAFGSRSCCQACYDSVVVVREYRLDRIDSRPLSEADYQTWAR